MAKKKEKGFDLGKSNNSSPGFELNKKSDTSEGFALGKGKDEKSPSFDLGKGEQGTSVKTDKKDKETKEVPMSGKATPLKKKNAEKAAKEKAEKVNAKASSMPSKEESATAINNKAPASAKKSKRPMLIGVLAVLLVGLYFFIPVSDGDETIQDSTASEEVAAPTQDQLEESPEGSETETNLSATEDNLETEASEVDSEGANDAAVSNSSNSGLSNDVVNTNGNTSDDAVSNSDGVTTQSRETVENANVISGSFSFGQNSTSVKISGNQLNDILSHLEASPNNSIIIEGHSSSEGDNFYNIGLSRRRAESVKAQLVLNGLNSDRILTVAKGSEFPIADNSTESGRAQNRRVEIKYN